MDEKEIRKRLASRAAEYMMFRNDEENAETTTEVSSSGNVIVFPDFEKLKSEVEKMRTELSMLLLERDELQFVICKNIETEYMLKLGSITAMSYSFLLQSIGVAEVRHYGGHMQHANSPMTNYLWTNSSSMKNIRVLSKSLV